MAPRRSRSAGINKVNRAAEWANFRHRLRLYRASTPISDLNRDEREDGEIVDDRTFNVSIPRSPRSPSLLRSATSPPRPRQNHWVAPYDRRRDHERVRNPPVRRRRDLDSFSDVGSGDEYQHDYSLALPSPPRASPGPSVSPSPVRGNPRFLDRDHRGRGRVYRGRGSRSATRGQNHSNDAHRGRERARDYNPHRGRGPVLSRSRSVASRGSENQGAGAPAMIFNAPCTFYIQQ
ncbi:peptidyl-prolyl cis-trans isomerase CYP95-like isoform X1 [Nasonia vitripennis]|uniref:Uncharacterized protein n=1 Tax=Nasonia vitripennis TaxID=7425 RepID=A0A7M7R3H6_NASVI|nr:peptidyl-prolyl cis-trans isomerase CYP95-like isoform X1 [Nasonia vitripennis]